MLHWQVWEWFYYRYSKTYLHFSFNLAYFMGKKKSEVEIISLCIPTLVRIITSSLLLDLFASLQSNAETVWRCIHAHNHLYFREYRCIYGEVRGVKKHSTDTGPTTSANIIFNWASATKWDYGYSNFHAFWSHCSLWNNSATRQNTWEEKCGWCTYRSGGWTSEDTF